MGRAVIRQPNGKLMIWSSMVDGPVYYDVTEDEYIEIKVAEAREEAKCDINKKKFIKNPDYINNLISVYGKDTEEIDELVSILVSVGYDSKKIREIINEQLAEELEDEDEAYQELEKADKIIYDDGKYVAKLIVE